MENDQQRQLYNISKYVFVVFPQIFNFLGYGGSSRPVEGHIGSYLSYFFSLWRRLGSVLEALEGVLEASWRLLEASRRRLEGVLKAKMSQDEPI